MAEKERYMTVWQECGANSRAAERFFVPGYDGCLPFLLWGDDLATFERNQVVELREEHLLKGILYGLYEFDHKPTMWHKKKDRETLLYLLDVLRKGFKYESLEEMILNVAYTIGEKHGSGPHRIVLEVGDNLVPNSSKVKSDLICATWGVIAERENVTELFERIISLIKEIDFEHIHSNAKEVVCFYGLCAMVFLGNEEGVTSYLPEYVYPNVSISKLKKKVNALLENPNDFTPADMKIV